VIGSLFRKLARLGFLVGVGVVVAKVLKSYKGAPEGVGTETFRLGAAETDDPFAIDENTLGGEVSPDLLERLVCPLDKGPLVLVDGKWLVNPRNGYRYPITDGIPVMLVEVGERYRDPAAIGLEAPAPVATSGSEA
jgi:uncharacterized protein YbaR (Trm112 family)